MTTTYTESWQTLPPGWEGEWGDRRTELVVIGQDMDHDAMTAALERCLMTNQEMEVYEKIFRIAQPPWTDRESVNEGVSTGVLFVPSLINHFQLTNECYISHKLLWMALPHISFN